MKNKHGDVYAIWWCVMQLADERYHTPSLSINYQMFGECRKWRLHLEFTLGTLRHAWPCSRFI